MRTRLAILLALTVALAIGSSALLTSQVGVTKWPAAPGPDTTTRLITPSEAAGRVTERESDDDRDEPAPRAQRDEGDRPAQDTETRTAPTTPVATERRPAATRPPDEPAEEDAPSTPGEPAEELSAPVAPAAPATATSTPVDDQHNRPDEVVPATAEATAVLPGLPGRDRASPTP